MSIHSPLPLSTIAAACLSVVAITAPALAHATTYTFRVLPALSGGLQASPAAIALDGTVVGSSTPPGAANPWPVEWNPVGLVHALTASTGRATGINQFGLVSGTMTSGTFNTRAVYWSQGVMHRLPDLQSNTSEANAVNKLGVMVGTDQTDPVYWPDRHTEALYGSPLNGFQDTGLALNLNSDLVGTSYIWEGQYLRQVAHFHPANGSTFTLNMPFFNGIAYGINNLGLIVGTSWATNGSNQVTTQWAIQWVNLQPVQLTWTTGFAGALGVNNAGHIVGWGNTSLGVSHAVLWQGGQPTDLNVYLDPMLAQQGYVMTRARAINDHDAIVGEMTDHYGHVLAWTLDASP
jgi:probable HAF family extracellular repeat protein